MRGFFLPSAAYLVVQAVLWKIPAPHSSGDYREFLVYPLTYSVLGILASVALVVLLLRRSASNLAHWLMSACAAVVAVGWISGLSGWMSEYRAGQALPIINIVLLAVPAGIVLGALVWLLAGVVAMVRGSGRSPEEAAGRR